MKSREDITIDEIENIVKIMKMEAKRCLGSNYFDYSIEYSGYSPYWAFFMACVDAGEKIIFQHSDLLSESENSKKSHNLDRVFQTYNRFDRIVSVTPELSSINNDNLFQHYSNNTIITYCNNGLGADRIRRLALQPLEIKFPQLALISQDESIFSFISVGRLSAEKNQARLLRAFAQVIAAGINSVLIVVGAGPERKNLTKLARRLGVHGRVIFCGLVENPYPLIQRAGCLVLSSDYEGQGLVLLEALTLDVPCVAVNCPPVAAFLKEDFGRLCDPNPESLAEAMIEVARSRMRPIGFSAEEYDSQCRQEFMENVLGLSSQGAH
jgi:CDP-glycerol glycerophosphotransferase